MSTTATHIVRFAGRVGTAEATFVGSDRLARFVMRSVLWTHPDGRSVRIGQAEVDGDLDLIAIAAADLAAVGRRPLAGVAERAAFRLAEEVVGKA